ncbi:hypothetical protein CONPUDRAFT_93394 [Coniophora puteana RWD-64-598 SS2]|uniref:Uncharacterized protein n=1 Tax=Coniophora puteana (strain RWD-64-598) TaxID=741705 RepID=A0A5M3M8Z0_CONPW|nr:uncharacterized protein CONPUDRAFT_93394 [Coniophora puteana RWD-64-598 SS2]EIW75679.1 hypothetical protein CONPUDRAFT_93394 [Coniophora puteana RWD-64-598 SS2]
MAPPYAISATTDQSTATASRFKRSFDQFGYDNRDDMPHHVAGASGGPGGSGSTSGSGSIESAASSSGPHGYASSSNTSLTASDSARNPTHEAQRTKRARSASSSADSDLSAASSNRSTEYETAASALDSSSSSLSDLSAEQPRHPALSSSAFSSQGQQSHNHIHSSSPSQHHHRPHAHAYTRRRLSTSHGGEHRVHGPRSSTSISINPISTPLSVISQSSSSSSSNASSASTGATARRPSAPSASNTLSGPRPQEVDDAVAPDSSMDIDDGEGPDDSIQPSPSGARSRSATLSTPERPQRSSTDVFRRALERFQNFESEMAALREQDGSLSLPPASGSTSSLASHAVPPSSSDLEIGFDRRPGTATATGGSTATQMASETDARASGRQPWSFSPATAGPAPAGSVVEDDIPMPMYPDAGAGSHETSDEDSVARTLLDVSPSSGSSTGTRSNEASPLRRPPGALRVQHVQGPRAASTGVDASRVASQARPGLASRLANAASASGSASVTSNMSTGMNASPSIVAPPVSSPARYVSSLPYLNEVVSSPAGLLTNESSGGAHETPEQDDPLPSSPELELVYPVFGHGSSPDRRARSPASRAATTAATASRTAMSTSPRPNLRPRNVAERLRNAVRDSHARDRERERERRERGHMERERARTREASRDGDRDRGGPDAFWSFWDGEGEGSGSSSSLAAAAASISSMETSSMSSTGANAGSVDAHPSVININVGAGAPIPGDIRSLFRSPDMGHLSPRARVRPSSGNGTVTATATTTTTTDVMPQAQAPDSFNLENTSSPTGASTPTPGGEAGSASATRDVPSGSLDHLFEFRPTRSSSPVPPAFASYSASPTRPLPQAQAQGQTRDQTQAQTFGSSAGGSSGVAPEHSFSLHAHAHAHAHNHEHVRGAHVHSLAHVHAPSYHPQLQSQSQSQHQPQYQPQQYQHQHQRQQQRVHEHWSAHFGSTARPASRMPSNSLVDETGRERERRRAALISNTSSHPGSGSGTVGVSASAGITAARPISNGNSNGNGNFYLPYGGGRGEQHGHGHGHGRGMPMAFMHPIPLPLPAGARAAADVSGASGGGANSQSAAAAANLNSNPSSNPGSNHAVHEPAVIPPEPGVPHFPAPPSHAVRYSGDVWAREAEAQARGMEEFFGVGRNASASASVSKTRIKTGIKHPRIRSCIIRIARQCLQLKARKARAPVLVRIAAKRHGAWSRGAARARKIRSSLGCSAILSSACSVGGRVALDRTLRRRRHHHRVQVLARRIGFGRLYMITI